MKAANGALKIHLFKQLIGLFAKPLRSVCWGPGSVRDSRKAKPLPTSKSGLPLLGFVIQTDSGQVKKFALVSVM